MYLYLFLFTLAITFIPLSLHASVTHDFVSLTWNDEVSMVLAVILIFAGMSLVDKRFNLDYKLITLCAALLVVIVGASWISTGGVRAYELVRLASVMIFAIYVDYLIRSFGRMIVAALLVFALLIHAQWGIAQFIIQDDLGLHLLNETRLSSERIGVAKFSPFIYTSRERDQEQGVASGVRIDIPVGRFDRLPSNANKIIRAYGPYSHANSFGGVLAIGMMAIMMLVISLAQRRPPRLSFSYRTILLLMIYVLAVGVIVSFSRTAYLAVFIAGVVGIGLIVMLLRQGRVRVSANKSINKLLMALMISVVLSLFLFTPLLVGRFFDRDDAALVERQSAVLWNVSLLKDLPLWRGIGPGTYKQALGVYLSEHKIAYEPWQLDYVHSVPLLIAAEWGVLATIISVGLLIWFFREHYQRLWYWLVPLVPLLLLDHYLFTQTAPLVMLVTYVLLVRAYAARTSPSNT